MQGQETLHVQTVGNVDIRGSTEQIPALLSRDTRYGGEHITGFCSGLLEQVLRQNAVMLGLLVGIELRQPAVEPLLVHGHVATNERGVRREYRLAFPAVLAHQRQRHSRHPLMIMRHHVCRPSGGLEGRQEPLDTHRKGHDISDQGILFRDFHLQFFRQSLRLCRYVCAQGIETDQHGSRSARYFARSAPRSLPCEAHRPPDRTHPRSLPLRIRWLPGTDSADPAGHTGLPTPPPFPGLWSVGPYRCRPAGCRLPSRFPRGVQTDWQKQIGEA